MKTEKEIKTVTNIFNAPTTVGNLGDNGQIDELNVINKDTSNNETPKPKTNKDLTAEEKKAVKRWKCTALIGFILYVLISFFLIYLYIQEKKYIMSEMDWSEFKKTDFSKVLIFIYTCLGYYLFNKLIYDRLLDPSKENAFIDLYRKKQK